MAGIDLSDRSKVLAIIGQGYVGLPLAMAAVDAGWSVIGIEKSTSRVKQLNSGSSPVEDISDARLAKAIAAKKFISPNLHSHRDEFVARKITELLTKYTPDAYKSSTTAKSLRIGSNTALAMHRDTTFHMQQACGGWSTGSRSDIYQEICPQLTYYAGTCLSGWSNCSKII